MEVTQTQLYTACPRIDITDNSSLINGSSLAKSKANEESNNRYPVHHTSTSCISVVTAKSSPHGSVSILTTSELPVNRKNLAPIPESLDSPTKKYFSFRTNPFKETPYLSFGANRQDNPKKSKFLDVFRSKLRLNTRLNAGREKTFEKICFELARADNSEVGSETCQIFDQVELDLKINTIGRKYNLVLPPAMDVAGLGDEEEQGIGGTCDQFIGVLPLSCRKVSEKASPLGLVPKLLPDGIISKEARYVGSCFWIWLCIVDDLTENLVGKAWDDCEADLFLAFSKNTDESVFNNKDDDAVRVSLALRNVIHSTNIRTPIVDSYKEDGWRTAFMKAVCEVLVGFREERPLLDGNKIAMFEWMRLRAITISVRPFLILARADLGLTPSVSALGNPLDGLYQHIIANNDDGKVSPLRKVECMLQLIMGLQNDILGWEKDYKQGNPLSAVQVLIQHGARNGTAMSRVVNAHNELVRRCIQHAQLVCDDPEEVLERLDYDGVGISTNSMSRSPVHPSVFQIFRSGSPAHRPDLPKMADADNIRRYVQLILGFANGMASWMAVSKRYIA